ncbi:MAG: metal-dependent phosphohydrolase [Betaproteobacteria bacterium]|nr:metal-dependent phosphohydrolase [Betaproteobacteria bacterium]
MKRRFPLHIHISLLFIALILLVGGVIGVLGYKISRDILETSASELNSRIGRETENAFTHIVAPAEMATRLLSFDSITEARSLDERLANLGFMREALSNSAALSSLYIGYGNGDFFLVRRILGEPERQFFAAPAQTTYIVQSIEYQDGAARGRFIFLDAALAPLRSDERRDYAQTFDPRQRDWYKAARSAQGQIKTPPYVFFSNQKVGITISNRAHKGDAVVGSDILLETLNQSLAGQKVTPASQVVLANQLGQTIGYEDASKAVKVPLSPDGKPVLADIADLGSPVLARLAPVLRQMNGALNQTLSLAVGDEKWHAAIQTLRLEGTQPLFLITAIPDRELMAAAYSQLRQALLVMGLVILLAIPITWTLARNISQPMRQLAHEAEAIRRFEFSQPIKVESLVLEVNDLAQIMDSMKRTIRRFIEISTAVAAERDFDRLLPRLLSETISAAEADGGLLYLNDNEKLLPTTALKADGTALPLSAASIAATATETLLGRALSKGQTSSGQLDEADIAALGLSETLAATGASHAIAVPLLNRDKNLVGALLLLRHAETDAARLSFIEAVSGSAAVSLENKELIKAQKLLFAAFIQLIASAIDAKSPYTGGHCARVPELTKMLARAACAETSGPYQNFQLNPEEWEAVHVAAWLHDCGKVTTPEYVVDKATKLETIYDRIHEVRMRFEVLKRDAEISSLKAIAAGSPEADAQLTLRDTLAKIDDDFAFVAHCNEGGEVMAAENLARLQAISQQSWTRTLDDRIGISHEELARKARTVAPPLPVSEPLLADKLEHQFERRAQDRMPADNPWGIRMTVPELLYNKGEVYNLGVARGTLSEEERYKINEHIVQTLIMLNQLPFPKHLRQVPEIAAGHHEKMDGSGYPRKLHKAEMSPLARMMAIADIFEALTAVDRPYKQGKTLSESIRIMSFMKKEQHIDPELFDLFLKSGVYLEYARQFMKAEQIDHVDIAAYLDQAPAV